MNNLTETITDKKNMIIVGALIIVLLIGSTFAFFADRDTKNATYTFGQVKMELSEPNFSQAVFSNITPNKEIVKDPVVSNTGHNDEYVFLEVKVPRETVKTANADGSVNAAANQDLFTYTVNSGWSLIKTTEGEKENVYVYAYGGEKMTSLSPNAATPALFNKIKLINLVENQIELESYDFNIEGYAIQTSDLGTENPLEIFNIIVEQTK